MTNQQYFFIRVDIFSAEGPAFSVRSTLRPSTAFPFRLKCFFRETLKKIPTFFGSVCNQAFIISVGEKDTTKLLQRYINIYFAAFTTSSYCIHVFMLDKWI